MWLVFFTYFVINHTIVCVVVLHRDTRDFAVFETEDEGLVL